MCMLLRSSENSLFAYTDVDNNLGAVDRKTRFHRYTKVTAGKIHEHENVTIGPTRRVGPNLGSGCGESNFLL